MDFKLGLDGKLMKFTGTGAFTYTGGVALTNVKDVSVQIEADTVDMTTRANQGWHDERATLYKGTMTVQVPYAPKDSTFKAFKDALLQRKPIRLAALTHEKGEGPVASWSVTSFPLNQALAEGQMIEIGLTMSEWETWYVGTGATGA